MEGTAALGCSVGTGWAVLVTVAVPGDPGAGLTVVDRRRVELAAGHERFAYHAAAERPLAEAEALIGAVRARAETAASAALTQVAAEVSAAGHTLAAAAVVGPPAPPTERPLARILASHPAIHTAEGELYRAAVRRAWGEVGAGPVTGAPAKGLADRVAAATGGSPEAVASTLATLGRVLGPPWRREHKDAALAGWLALLGG